MPARKATPRHPVHLVAWVDASDAFGAWSTAEAAARANDTDALVESVGYVVDISPDHVTLATSCVECDGVWHYGGGVNVPRVLIRRNVRLA